MKGETALNSYLNLPTNTKTYHKLSVDVLGFGNPSICDSDVMHGDTRIIMATLRNSNLTLNSSLVRLGLTTLKRRPSSQAGG